LERRAETGNALVIRHQCFVKGVEGGEGGEGGESGKIVEIGKVTEMGCALVERGARTVLTISTSCPAPF
jgi:hypothetical protein